MSPYSRFYRRAEQPAPVRIKRAHTTAAIADKSAGKIIPDLIPIRAMTNATAGAQTMNPV